MIDITHNDIIAHTETTVMTIANDDDSVDNFFPTLVAGNVSSSAHYKNLEIATSPTLKSSELRAILT